MSDAVVIGGANGAGKTTFARQVVPTLHPTAAFLNADEIQSEGLAFSHPVAAGKELLRRLGEAEMARLSFAIETTLSSNMYAKRMLRWTAAGYHVSLHFIELPSEEYAVQRVAKRVAAGGHSVAEVDIRRRYHRGIDLFHRVYKPLVDEWYHWLSDDEGLRLGEHYER